MKTATGLVWYPAGGLGFKFVRRPRRCFEPPDDRTIRLLWADS